MKINSKLVYTNRHIQRSVLKLLLCQFYGQQEKILS